MKQKTPKQRNPYVEHIRFKKQGSHEKGKKASHRADRKSVKQELKRYG